MRCARFETYDSLLSLSLSFSTSLKPILVQKLVQEVNRRDQIGQMGDKRMLKTFSPVLMSLLFLKNVSSMASNIKNISANTIGDNVDTKKCTIRLY